MKEDVGTSKPEKHVNKVGSRTQNYSFQQTIQYLNPHLLLQGVGIMSYLFITTII